MEITPSSSAYHFVFVTKKVLVKNCKFGIEHRISKENLAKLVQKYLCFFFDKSNSTDVSAHCDIKVSFVHLLHFCDLSNILLHIFEIGA